MDCPMNQLLAMSSSFPFANDTISSFCQAVFKLDSQTKSPVLTLTVFKEMSIPLFLVDPILAKVLVKPVRLGIDISIRRSRVREVYKSTVPDIRLLRREKSTPRLYWVVFSQPKLWLAMARFPPEIRNSEGTYPGKIVVPKG